MGREPNEKNKSNIKIDNSINTSQSKNLLFWKRLIYYRWLLLKSGGQFYLPVLNMPVDWEKLEPKVDNNQNH
jgi:hypothetical protein